MWNFVKCHFQSPHTPKTGLKVALHKNSTWNTNRTFSNGIVIYTWSDNKFTQIVDKSFGGLTGYRLGWFILPAAWQDFGSESVFISKSCPENKSCRSWVMSNVYEIPAEKKSCWKFWSSQQVRAAGINGPVRLSKLRNRNEKLLLISTYSANCYCSAIAECTLRWASTTTIFAASSVDGGHPPDGPTSRPESMTPSFPSYRWSCRWSYQ